MADKQVTGNIGLYYVCYRLSGLGWNVMPTARNARGIDILAYSQDASRRPTFQVKSVSAKYAVGLGKRPEYLFADYLVVCRTDRPECFILTATEAKELARPSGKAPDVTYWLEAREYEADQFREKWDRLGFAGIIAAEGVPPPDDGPTSYWSQGDSTSTDLFDE